MVDSKPLQSFSKKPFVGPRVRALREQRRWSQGDLGGQLGVSQARLSRIERGESSFTAEQFLKIPAVFNVGAEHFAEPQKRDVSPVQNALARHGAAHLVETDVLVPQALDEPAEVVWEVLRNPESSRHLTALAPVFVAHADRIALPALATRLAGVGREARLGWLLENLHQALGQDVPIRAAERRQARRAALEVSRFLESGVLRPSNESSPFDLLDPQIRTAKTAELAIAESDLIARRWRIATSLRSSDFLSTLRAAREAR